MTNPESLQPVNRLEQAIFLAKDGRMNGKDFVKLLLDADIVVPSAVDAGNDMARLEPLVVDRSGTTMVVVFSEASRALKFAEKAPYLLICKAHQLLPRLGEGIGLVVNPGYKEGLEISPNGIADIVADFAI